MKFIKCAALCLAVLLAVLIVACSSKKESKSPGLEEAVSTAVDSYLYGYPLVTFDVARLQQTNVALPDAEHAPMGQMIRMRTYPAVDNHCCAAPNPGALTLAQGPPLRSERARRAISRRVHARGIH